jgi:hypothetical protein
MTFSRSKSNESSSSTATPTTTALLQWFPKATGFMLQKMACGCSGDINEHIVAEDDEHDMFDDVSVLDGRFHEGASRRYDHAQEHEHEYMYAPGTESKSSLSSRSSQQQPEPVYHLSEDEHGRVSDHAPLPIRTRTSCTTSSSRKSPVSPVPSYATASTVTMQTFEDIDIDDDDDHEHRHNHQFHEDEEEEVQSTASTQVISHLLKLQTPSKSSRHYPNVVSPNDQDHHASEIPRSGDAYRVLLRMPPRQLELPQNPSLHSLPRNSNIRPRVRSTPSARRNPTYLIDLPSFPAVANTEFETEACKPNHLPVQN